MRGFIIYTVLAMAALPMGAAAKCGDCPPGDELCELVADLSAVDARQVVGGAHDALSRGDLDQAQKLASRGAAWLLSTASQDLDGEDRRRMTDEITDVGRGLLARAHDAIERGDYDAAQDLANRVAAFVSGPAGEVVSDFDQQRMKDHSTDLARGLLSRAHDALGRGDYDAAQDLSDRVAVFLDSPSAELVSDFDKQRLQDHSTDVARGLLGRAHSALARGDLDAAQDLANRVAIFLDSKSAALVNDFDRQRLQEHSTDVARGLVSMSHEAESG